MGKHIRRLVITLLMLIVTFISTSTTIFAETEELLKDKTNKLKLSDDLKEKSKYIKESLAAGKSLTYKIEVNKGALYIDLKNDTSFKVEIYNSTNKVVMKMEAYEMLGGVTYMARDGVGLSKGKYKIKISPMSKDNALNINGTIVMIKNSTSRTIAFDNDCVTAVTEGKTYKFKFEVKEKSPLVLSNLITSYTPDELFPFIPDYKVVNSEGKTVKKYNNSYIAGSVTLEKGTYTLVVKANKTGYLSTKVYN